MKLSKLALCAFTLVSLASGTALAGEDSTDRWHGTGPHYYDTAGGLPAFDQSKAEGSWPSDHFRADHR